MTKVALFKQDGSNAGEIELNDAVFGIEPNEAVIFDAVVMQQASLRQGTHKAKTRAEVRGGGRKPWRQKGTGRARAGSSRLPHWTGGGVAGGPTPRSYSYRLPKKVRRLAIRSVLSQKVQEGNLLVIDSLQLDSPKTKDFKTILNNLEVDSKTLLIVEQDNENAYLSARNLPNIKVIDEHNVNVLDVFGADKVLITQSALQTVEEALA